MIKKILINILLVIVPFIIVESTARIVYSLRHTDTALDNKKHYIQAHDTLHHVWTPGIYYLSPRNIDVKLIINNQRFVEKENISKTPSENSLRGFFVGDSNVQGVVNFEDKMVEIVENNFRSIKDKFDVNSVEFINSGTSSYSPLIYYILIKKYLIKYSPDFVFICVDMTDLANDYAIKNSEGLPYRIIGEETKSFVLTPTGYTKRSFLERIKLILIDYSKTVYYLDRLYYKTATPTKNTDTEIPKTTEVANWLKEPYDSSTESAIKNTFHYLEKIFEILQRKDIQVFLTGVPHYPQYTGRWSAKPHFLLDTLAKVNDVPYLNTYEELKPIIEGSEKHEYYFKSDPTHLNVKGNWVWSDIVTEFMIDNLMLSENK